MKTYSSRKEAQAALMSMGYTEFEGLSQCGDYGQGSREYWSKPNSPKNDYGVPTEQRSISRLGNFWVMSQ